MARGLRLGGGLAPFIKTNSGRDRVRGMRRGDFMAAIIDYQNVVRRFNAVFARVVRENVDAVAAKKELSARRTAALVEFNKNTDGMFSAVFRFREENFHSELLRKILDPHTPETGDKRFLAAFMELLGHINPSIPRHDFSDAVRVERETERIDILIYDETHAVIIENKINNAPDQPNQLARYYQAVQGMGKKVIAVVYISQFEECEPPLDDYDDAYQKFVPHIKSSLVVLPAVNRCTGKNDIANGFIAQCVNCADANSPQNYMVSQYAKLLKTIEGASKMTAAIDREFITEFYKDKESIETIENIADVWDKRDELLGSILRQPLWEKLKSELGFYEEEGEEWVHSLFCDISDNLYIVLYSDPSDNELHLGFWYASTVIKAKAKKESMEKVLNNVLTEAFAENDYWGEESHPEWLTKQFLPGEYKAPIAEIEAYFIDRCKKLIAAANELDL